MHIEENRDAGSLVEVSHGYSRDIDNMKCEMELLVLSGPKCRIRNNGNQRYLRNACVLGTNPLKLERGVTNRRAKQA